jgi:hypothetical protein
LWIVMDLNNSFLNTIRYVSRETRLLYAITTSRISIIYIIGSSVESPIFCDDNAFCASYIALSQTTCIQNLLHMPPVVIDLSNHSRIPSFTNVVTGIIHWHNGTRWLWHNGTGTASGIKDKGWNLTACYYSRQSWYATVGTKRHTGRSPSPVSLMFTSSLKCLNCTPDRYSIYHVISPYSCTNNVTV